MKFIWVSPRYFKSWGLFAKRGHKRIKLLGWGG